MKFFIKIQWDTQIGLGKIQVEFQKDLYGSHKGG